MPKVKIIVEDGETMFEAEEMLFKALNASRTGEAHTENFDDPAMRSVLETMETMHKKQYEQMMREIEDILDEEYGLNYGDF
jgi:hypothetical protein